MRNRSTTGSAFFSDEQAQDPEWRQEEDPVLWSKGKKGKKGLSTGNDGFHKGCFRPYQPNKGAGKDFPQNKGRRKDQKGKCKVGTYPQSRFKASETPNEEGYGQAWGSDDWSASHWNDDSWTPDAGRFCTRTSSAWMAATPLNLANHPTCCSGSWLHTVDWIKNGNRKIQEACVVLWHYDGILPL